MILILNNSLVAYILKTVFIINHNVFPEVVTEKLLAKGDHNSLYCNIVDS